MDNNNMCKQWKIIIEHNNNYNTKSQEQHN